MNSKDETRNDDEQSPVTPEKPKRRRWMAYSLAGLVGILGATGISVVAMGGPDGWCHGGYERMHWGGKHHGGFGSAKMREFAEHKVDRVLYELDGTQEQRQRVKEILSKAFEDIGDRRETRRKDRQAFVEVLTQPEIDRAKLQTLRTEKLKQMEELSERMVHAVADVAEVLTPEQRVKLAEMIEERGFGRRHRW